MDSLKDLMAQKGLPPPTKEEENFKFREVLPQVLAMTAKNLLLLTLGMLLAFPATVIPVVTNPSNNSTLHLTLKQASWYGGFTYIFHPLGSMISGALLQPLGCKKLMILSNIPVLLCWVMTYRAQTILDLYVAGGLTGFALGLMAVTPTRYTSETIHPSIRSILTMYSQLFNSLGHFTVYLLSSVLGWRHVALICATVPIICTTALLWVPESPMWLMSKGRTQDALKSLQWLRGFGSPDSIKEEFDKLAVYAKKRERSQRILGFRQMLRDLEEEGEGQGLVVVPQKKTDEKANRRTGNTPDDNQMELLEEYFEEKSWREKFHELSRLEVFMPMCKLMLVFTTACLCGVAPMKPFIIKIYGDLNLPIQGTKIAAFQSILSLFNTIFFMFIIKKVGKRKLFLCSSTIAVICLILLAKFSHKTLVDKANNVPNDFITGWLTVAVFVLHSFALSLGLWPIPWILLGEILPFKGRGMATGILVSFYYIIIFIGVKVYPILEQVLKLHGTFLFFAIGAIPCVITLYFVIPEMEGKFLADIEAEMTNNKEAEWKS